MACNTYSHHPQRRPLFDSVGILLEHEYTAEALHCSLLKGRDRDAYETLIRAANLHAQNANYKVLLSVVRSVLGSHDVSKIVIEHLSGNGPNSDYSLWSFHNLSFFHPYCGSVTHPCFFSYMVDSAGETVL
jgi:hypothetical protein